MRKPKASLRDALWAQCPILWRRPLLPSDSSASDSYVCWTWLGAVIPAEDWDSKVVPLRTPYLPWRDPFPEKAQKEIEILRQHIKCSFLDSSLKCSFEWREGNPFPVGNRWEFHVLLWELETHTPRSKRELASLINGLRNLLRKVSDLPEELREEGYEYQRRLEQLLGL